MGNVTFVKEFILTVLSFFDAILISFLLCDLLQTAHLFKQVNGEHVNGKQDIV
jgi:hypothetical protein